MITIISSGLTEASHFIKSAGFTKIDELNYGTIHHSYKFPDIRIITDVKNIKLLTADMANKGNSSLIVSIGFATSVKAGLNTGNLVICNNIFSLTGPPAYWSRDSASELTTDPLPREENFQHLLHELRRGPIIGNCLTLPQHTVNTNMKNWIGYRFPVSIIDTDAHHIVEQCKISEIPCMIIRSIVDPLPQATNESMSFEVGRITGNNSLRLFDILLCYPAAIVKALKTATRQKEASSSLSAFLLTYATSKVKDK